MVESKEFDVVLSDIGLPDGSGYEVIAQAKRKEPLKGVALTGFDKEEDIRRSKEAGFDFHLTKPVDFHELRTVLAQVCSSSTTVARLPLRHETEIKTSRVREDRYCYRRWRQG